MKSVVKEKSSKQKSSIPSLVKGVNTGVILLRIDTYKFVVVGNPNEKLKLGKYYDNILQHTVEPFDGSVTLSNEE